MSRDSAESIVHRSQGRDQEGQEEREQRQVEGKRENEEFQWAGVPGQVH